jgi:hypothetical protein
MTTDLLIAVNTVLLCIAGVFLNKVLTTVEETSKLVQKMQEKQGIQDYRLQVLENDSKASKLKTA